MKTQHLNNRSPFDFTAVVSTRGANKIASIAFATLLVVGSAVGSIHAQDAADGEAANGQTANNRAAQSDDEVRPTRRATLPPQVEKIDKALEASWSEAGIRPSPVEEDLKWVRRVYLDIIGRIPSFEEFASFAKDKSPDRRS